MVRRKIILLAAISALSLGFIGKTQNAFADAESNCKSAASSKYGNRYTIHQATFDKRCHDQGGDGNYGTAVPEYTDYPEWTRLSGENLSFSIRRVTYSVGTSSYDTGANMSGCIEDNVTNASITGSPMELMTIKAGTKRTWIGTGTYHIGMAGKAVKGGWSNWDDGGTATVSFNPSAASASANVNSDGLVENSFNIVTHLFCYDTKKNENTIYYKYYKITRIQHDTPKATYNGTDYSGSSTSEASPITVADGAITFTHYLKRNDGWTNPSSASLTSVYKREVKSGSTSVKSDSSWQGATLKSGGTAEPVTDSVNISALNLSPNVATQVCSTVTHRNVKGLHGHTASDDSASNVDSSTICVWVKDDRILLSPGSRSRADNSIQMSEFAYSDGGSKTAESWDSSRGGSKTYTYSFVHQLKLQGNSGYAYNNIQYYVTETKNGSTTNIAGSSSAPLTTSINSGNNAYVTVSTSNGTFDPIDAGGTTPTICQTIYFRPKTIQVKLSSGVTTETDTAWQSSTACALVKRRNTKTSTLSATCSASVNGAIIDQSNPVTQYSTVSPFQFMFGFNIDRNTTSQNLSTTYTIKRSINGGPSTVVKSNTITIPKTGITDSPQIAVDEGTSKQVCETISVDPASYTIHTNADGSESTVQSGDAIAGARDLVTCCGTAAVPKRELRDDGEITVYSESEGSLDNPNQTGGYSDTQGAWLMKTASADITYTHKLWREAEKHQGDGVHQADVTSPAEDVTVRYRFDDPSASFAATSITNAHTSTVATNTASSKYSLQSVSASANPTDQLLNANTVATASEVGKHYSYCQSNYYVSEKYTLRGLYWEVDGQIYAADPYLQGVQDPVSKEVVGKSTAACVDVIRPWNFRATQLVPDGDTSTPVTVGSVQSAKFELTVGKNDANYLITDIPNATLRFVAFTIEGTDALSANYSGNIDSDSDPCSWFQSQTSASCSTLEERTENIGPSGANGTTFYPSRNDYTYTIKSNNFTIPDHSTSQKYCIAVGVTPSNSNDGFNLSSNWAISNATCYNIGKYPNFQIWGGSTFTNGGIKTSHTQFDNQVFGSWDDFALIANKNILRTGSGASLISGLSATGTVNCTMSPITIANSKCNSSISTDLPLGGAGITVGTANFLKKFQELYLDDAEKYTVASTVNQDALQSGRNPKILYNPNGDIYISSNIVPSGSTSRSYSTPNVPQVIVYAKGNINIDESVNEINAWLIADNGTVNTCVDSSQATPALSAKTCTFPLVINGPIVANKVLFNRTANGDVHTNTLPNYAELVNFSAATYLFAANEASGAQPITTYLQKLPPRY